MTNEEKIIQGAKDFANRFEPVMKELAEEEKIKEILNQDKYNKLRGVRLVEQAMQEYGKFVREQTLEEAEKELTTPIYHGDTGISTNTITYDCIKWRLQSLKDNN